MGFKPFRLWIWTAVLLLSVSLSVPGRSLQEIKRSGKIYVGFTQWDYRNINYPLALEFARYLNVRLVDVTIDWNDAFSWNGKIPSDLETNPDLSYSPDAFREVDIICSTFSTLEWRRKLFDFAETLYSAELLITGRDQQLPRDFSELKEKKVAFMAGTSFETHMKEISREIGGGINLVPVKTDDDSKKLLLGDKVYAIVLDADEALNFNTQNGNKFQIVFPVSPVTHSAWAVEKNSNLRLEVEDFFETISGNGVLDKIFNDKFHVTYSSFVDKIRRTSRPQVYHRDLKDILASKKLMVALRERDFVYHEGEHRQFMHALAEEFADYLGVKLDYIITPNSSKYWENYSGRIIKDSTYIPDWFNYFDLACDIFIPADWRTNKIDMVSLFPTEYSLVAPKKTHIASLDELPRLRGVAAKGTVYEDMLLKRGVKKLVYTDVDHFLQTISEGKADYAIVINAFFELSSYPDLEVKFPLGETDICWSLRKDQPELKETLCRFIDESRKNGLIRILDHALRENEQYSPDEILSSYYESFQKGQLPYILYGTEDGLPQEDVFTIFQDRKGYMWFGTNSGAARYNGREMQTISVRQGLPGNSVFSIAEDTSGLLYIATSKGIAVLREGKVQRILFEGESVSRVYIDAVQNKWFAGENVLYMEDPKGRIINYSGKLPNVSDITYSPSVKAWYFATPGGIYMRLQEGLPQKVSSTPCYAVYADINDSIWVSWKDGLSIVSGQNLRQGRFEKSNRQLNIPLGLSNALVKQIIPSRYGSVWLITDYRLYQVISTEQKAMVYEQEIGLKNNTILSFFEDAEDNLWIGFSGGLQRLTNKRGLRNFFPNVLNSYIYSVIEDKKDRIWVASNNGLFYFSDKLVNFGQEINVGKGRCVVGDLPDGDIVIGNTAGLKVVDQSTLKVIREYQFVQPLSGLENIFISSRGEIFLLTGVRGKIYYLRHPDDHPIAFENRSTSNVFSLTETGDGRIIGGNNTGLIAFNGYEFRQLKDVGCAVWSVCYDDDKLWLGTDCGLMTFANNEIQKVTFSNRSNLVIKAIAPARNRAYLWIGTNNGFLYLNKLTRTEELSMDSKDGLMGDEITADGLYVDSKGVLWIGTYHGLSDFNIRASTAHTYSPICYIERMYLNGDEIKPGSRKVFKHWENNLVFEISALSFTDEQSVEYEFYLRGLANDYSSYNKGKEYKAFYSNLPPGSYEFIYKARGKNGVWGYAQKYSFTILKAWYETWAFRITLIVFILGAVWLLYHWRVRRIEAQKRKLEQLVKERTIELEEANIEIEAQRDMAERQRDQITQQKKEIMDSIRYAEQIQKSVLPSGTELKDILPEYFIMFRPRDIVSGDFYWAAHKNGTFILTAADSTGHGVPGAFMSLLGVTFLNEIVTGQDQITAGEILNQLRVHIVKALGQQGMTGEHKDGMDMALCMIDKENKKCQFAGANNPLYIIRKGELHEIKGDKMPVAIHEDMHSFTTHELSLEEGDVLYMFSDGYADQFGGPAGKKLMNKALRKTLLSISSLPMNRQHDILEERFDQWKKGYEQVDDVLIVGVRI